MKRILFSAALAAALPASVAFGANVDVNIGVSVGARPAVVVPAPPPPVPAPPVLIEEPPLFIEPPQLGFHVAVGIPHDIFFIGGSYYLVRNNVWYVAPHYRGPWVVTRYHAIPWKLRKHSFERIRYYRDSGYREYKIGKDPYWRHHHFRPEKELKEAGKVERKQLEKHWKDDRKWEKERWKHERKGGHDGPPHGKHW